VVVWDYGSRYSFGEVWSRGVELEVERKMVGDTARELTEGGPDHDGLTPDPIYSTERQGGGVERSTPFRWEEA
jgi:hypothetical protein